MREGTAFFFVCAGIFLLALSYHLGARSAGAQAPGNPVVGVTTAANVVAVTSNGDVYQSTNGSGEGPWTFRANIFSGPTPAQSISIGQLKAKYATPAGK